MKVRELFETTEYSRCGGCGRYSWNQRDGDRCYGCNGSGLAFTKDGQAAYYDWVKSCVVDVKVSDVQEGWWVSLGNTQRRTIHHWICVQGIHPYLGKDIRFQGRNSGLIVRPTDTVLRRHDAETRKSLFREMQSNKIPGVSTSAVV